LATGERDGHERPELHDVSADAFHQAMSRLRQHIGAGPDGWYIPPAVKGAYRIGPRVGCDWTLFQTLVAEAEDAAARHDTATAIAYYREALELVEGEPFVDVPPGAYTYADTKGLLTDIPLAVAKAAHDLAALALPTDARTALWAAEQGRLILPTQLKLFDMAGAAAAELGDAAALERILQAKCWAHERLDPDGGVPPETMALFRHLRERMAARELEESTAR
jgi:hypothetical protein